MKHLVIVKMNENAPSREEFIQKAKEAFAPVTDIPGIRAVRVIPGLPLAENRYDFIVEIDMDKESLPAYNESEAHKSWKKNYGAWILSKAIFDCEDEI